MLRLFAILALFQVADFAEDCLARRQEGWRELIRKGVQDYVSYIKYSHALVMYSCELEKKSISNVFLVYGEATDIAESTFDALLRQPIHLNVSENFDKYADYEPELVKKSSDDVIIDVGCTNATDHEGEQDVQREIFVCHYEFSEAATSDPFIDEAANRPKAFDMLVITDSDKKARIEKYRWEAVTRRGTLFLSPDWQEVRVDWMRKSDVHVESLFSYKGRGMEMSDLVKFNGHILAPDDKTGIIFAIENDKAIPWVILSSGPGNSTAGMKIEWLTLKDSLLYAGGHGTEYRDGSIENEDNMWVKTITEGGEVKHVDWRNEFTKVRDFAGYPAPGYLTHEAVQWSEIHQKWFFLPRKASKTIYDEDEDETKGANIMITADPTFTMFENLTIGEPTPDRGFSAFVFIPGTDDQVIVALKSKEVGNITESFITAFDIRGHVLLEDQKLADDYKFEGLFLV